jgi:hypothetical protein
MFILWYCQKKNCYVYPIGEKERTSIKTKRGMKNECIHNLEIMIMTVIY